MRRGILYRTVRGWDASRRIAPMGQCEVQIQADVGRAEPIHWKSCLIPLMHGFELVWFRCGIPAVVVSFLLIDCLDDLFLHAVIRFPDVNSHSCRMSRTNAPSDTMPHDSWLGCDPARCGNGAVRGLELKRTVGAQHGVRKRCGLCATFRPPTVSVATRTLTSGARRNGRRARDAGRSCGWLPTLEPTLVAWTADPCAELAGRGSGGHRSYRTMKAGGGGEGGGGTQMPQCRFRPLGRLNIGEYQGVPSGIKIRDWGHQG